MLVVDASALIDLLVADPGDIPELAGRVREVAWVSAPDLLDYEVLNVLRRMVVRGHIDAELADLARLAVREMRLTRHPLTNELTDRIWELRRNVSAYDAAYLALAEQLNVPLVTTDRRLARAAEHLESVTIECFA